MAQTSSRIHLVIRGHVQGVGFRWFVERAARLHGLSGWVRNNPDGTVECEAEGIRHELELFLHEIRTADHPAQVAAVKEHWEDGITQWYTSFEIRF